MTSHTWFCNAASRGFIRKLSFKIHQVVSLRVVSGPAIIDAVNKTPYNKFQFWGLFGVNYSTFWIYIIHNLFSFPPA
jgi:hypothetical protein